MFGKIFLGIALVAITSLLGYKYSDKYDYRQRVLTQLYDFAVYFNSRVGFVNETVQDALTELKNKIPETLKNSDGFFQGESFVCEDKKLSVHQRELVSSFINSLGVSDSSSQKALTSSYIEFLKNELTSAKTYAQKIVQLSVKLGFSLGLVIFIIII